MPRRKPDLRLRLNEEFRERMIERQREKDWTDETLARHASDYHPMTAAIIWKIRKSDPPRRVDIDEMHAIIKAFGAKDLDDFLEVRDYEAIAAEAHELSATHERLRADIDLLQAQLKKIQRKRPRQVWANIRANEAGGLHGWSAMTSDLIDESARRYTTVAESAQQLHPFFSKHLSEEQS